MEITLFLCQQLVIKHSAHISGTSHTFSGISSNKGDISINGNIKRFSEHYDEHDREQSIEEEYGCYADSDERFLLKEDLQKLSKINEQNVEYPCGSYTDILTDSNGRCSVKVNPQKSSETDHEYESEQTREYQYCSSNAGISTLKYDSLFKNSQQKPNKSDECPSDKCQREHSLKYQYGTYADISTDTDDKPLFKENLQKPIVTDAYCDDEYQSEEYQHDCYAGISTDSDDRNSLKDDSSKPSQDNEYIQDSNEKEQSAEYPHGSYAGISTDSDDRYSAKENVPKSKKKLQKNKYDYIVSSVGMYILYPFNSAISMTHHMSPSKLIC